MASRRRPPPSCSHGCAECAAGACMLCVCCPLSMLWCCIRLPFRYAWRACNRDRERRNIGASSSFSDIDFDAELVEMELTSDDGRGRSFCFEFAGRGNGASSAITRSSKVSSVLFL